MLFTALMACTPQQFAMLVAADFLTALFNYATHKYLIRYSFNIFRRRSLYLIPYNSRPGKYNFAWGGNFCNLIPWAGL
jgi:hypothetical protein